MEDSNTLKVMCLFEAGAVLESGDELIGLAANLYHRFFKLNPDMNQFDLYTFAAACIKLAYWFYEKRVKDSNLCIVMADIARGVEFLGDESLAKLEHSVKLAAKIVAYNLNHEVNYRDKRAITPGDFCRENAKNVAPIRVYAAQGLKEEPDSEFGLEEDEILLSRNSKYEISPHRYLVHYLKTIKLLVDPKDEQDFQLVCNLSWIFLSDLHWSPYVITEYGNHLACSCLMTAIEALRQKLRKKQALWKLLNKQWNLIFCDDLDNKRSTIIISKIVEQYDKYNRALQTELTFT